MALPLIAMAIGAGLGGLKQMQDQKAANDANHIAAIKEMYSPWTGQHGQMAAQPSAIQNIGSGALTGASFGMGMDESAAATKQAEAGAKAKEAEAVWLQHGFSPYNFGTSPGARVLSQPDYTSEVYQMPNSSGLFGRS